jgi:hypothetical protein
MEKDVLASISDYPPYPPPTAELRASGPQALDLLFRLREQLLVQMTAAQAAPATPESPHELKFLERQQARLDRIIDDVGMQRYCSRSRLFWYTDFDQAKAAARTAGKPILSLRMLGNLHEDFSCANSRFFRTTLYANEEISRVLRDEYILHWKSVRPVPRVTIDFGDGRKLERTLTGNSIHYVLTPEGEVVEALPGLYGPKAFLTKISEGVSLARRAAALSPTDRLLARAAYHQERYDALGQQFVVDLLRAGKPAAETAPPRKGGRGSDPPPANDAAALARPKAVLERPLIAAALPMTPDPLKLEDEEVWEAIAALHAEEAKIDGKSRELIRSENPTAAVAARLAVTKRAVENPLVRLVRTLESSIALDSVKNEYRLHRQIHQWLASAAYLPDVDTLNERVYAEIFLTPSSDPWLGLAPPEVYTALPNGGVVTK